MLIHTNTEIQIRFVLLRTVHCMMFSFRENDEKLDIQLRQVAERQVCMRETDETQYHMIEHLVFDVLEQHLRQTDENDTIVDDDDELDENEFHIETLQTEQLEVDSIDEIDDVEVFQLVIVQHDDFLDDDEVDDDFTLETDELDDREVVKIIVEIMKQM